MIHRRSKFTGKRPQRGPPGFEDNIIQIKRCTKVVKGGKRLRFTAMAVVGDHKGLVGVGLGKAKEVPFAVSKAVKKAHRNVFKVAMKNTTIPHRSSAKYSATTVLLRPAAPGTGVVAGPAVRHIVELVGIKDILSKVMGSTNPSNVAKATVRALQQLKSKSAIEQLRNVKIE